MAEYRNRISRTVFPMVFKAEPADVPLAGDDGEPGDHALGHALVEESKPRLKRPPMYKVIMFNDDYTPMEFVVDVLETFFGMNREKATRVMLRVHTEGRAVCGVFSRDVAETKSAQVMKCAREHQHPLVCEIEPGEGDSE